MSNIGGSYNHKRCKYFGVYSNKMVDRIYEIEDIFIYDKNRGVVNASFSTKISDELKNKIIRLFNENNDYQEVAKKYEMQVFKLKNATEVYPPFKKTTLGGMYGSKIYFTFKKSECVNIKVLAKTISGKRWEDFRK